MPLLSYAGEDGGFLHSKEDGSASGSNALAGSRHFALDAVLLLQNGSGGFMGLVRLCLPMAVPPGTARCRPDRSHNRSGTHLCFFIFLLIFLETREEQELDSRK